MSGGGERRGPMAMLVEDYGFVAVNAVRQIDYHIKRGAVSPSMPEHLVSLEERAVENATKSARVARRIYPNLRGE